jgi:hypothetical protein
MNPGRFMASKKIEASKAQAKLELAAAQRNEQRYVLRLYVAGYRGRGGGLVFYTAEDDSGLHWKRHNLSSGGVAAASCAIVDLNGDSKPDILSIGASTANVVWFENAN